MLTREKQQLRLLLYLKIEIYVYIVDGFLDRISNQSLPLLIGKTYVDFLKHNETNFHMPEKLNLTLTITNEVRAARYEEYHEFSFLKF